MNMMLSKFINYDIVPGDISPSTESIKINGIEVPIIKYELNENSGEHLDLDEDKFSFIFSTDSVKIMIGETIIELCHNICFMINETKDNFVYKTNSKSTFYMFFLGEKELNEIVNTNIFNDVSADFFKMWDEGDVTIK
ncbi:MAG: hypothetical protein CMD32_07645 [Flavobacteriales bacterium]|nr:hypothetical protein [Flavobacteriales bacterium]|tara:strand:+ start:4298 stop:4711 length:414 start_codon:yes stop_codon:yes gene_type:complete